VVEGHGDVESVPILLRRCAVSWNPLIGFEAPKPVRIPRSKLLKPGELERGVELASYHAQGGGVLVLIDADDDCPATLGPQLLARARTVTQFATVVLAKSEFESWFLAAAASVAGRRGLATGLAAPATPEDIRDAKGWLTRAMGDPHAAYSETLDQPALTAVFDLDAARVASASFDKFSREMNAFLGKLQEHAEEVTNGPPAS
jgi:hypothetical protein